MARTNTKAHVACYVLKRSGPLTRIELMKRVHVLEGKQGAFKPTSNISYFLTTPYYGNSSFLRKGLIKVVGKTKSGSFIYDITDEGRALADSYVR